MPVGVDAAVDANGLGMKIQASETPEKMNQTQIHAFDSIESDQSITLKVTVLTAPPNHICRWSKRSASFRCFKYWTRCQMSAA